MQRVPNARLAGAVLSVALISCADITPPPQLTTLDYLLAEPTSAMTGNPVAFIAYLGPAPAVPPYVTSCTYNTASTFFVCPEQTDRGLAFNLSFQLLDSAGLPLATLDESKTASIHSQRTVDGNFVLTNGDTVWSYVKVRADKILSGLLSDSRIINGTDTVITTLGQNATQPTTTRVITVSDYRPRVRGLPTSFPASGTISSAITTSTLLVPSTTPFLTYVMTFNGSATVTWVRTLNGVTSTCTYNYTVGGSPQCL